MRLRRSNAGIMESTDMRLLRRLNSNHDFDDPATAIVVDVLLVAVIVAGALFLLSLTAVAAEGRWQQVENKTNCAVWDPYPHSKSTVTWSGTCENGKVGYGRPDILSLGQTASESLFAD